ncbi:hydroxyethylthiazole kinase [Atopobacter phocae]|uniref:hydroxyethylthiazole kinase n=1 Tax=Atopobacter phocae TaxID=136492 RepID=UPI00046F269D|nr:hydroxyethylthiazole kinase [Atopobacter phocae]
MLEKMLNQVKETSPLVHNITNYVTANDCANILLACGGSPIMADDVTEVEDITSICDSLNINLGTLNDRSFAAMKAAGKKANELNHPVVFDPVGAGASPLRTTSANELVDTVQFTVIRGNISEIKTLANGSGTTRGVDADVADQVTEDTMEQAVAFAKDFAKKTGAVIAITGAIDIVADANQACCIYNGHAMMSRVTGTGCQLSALTGAYLAANPTEPFEAAVAAITAMGVCGEIAHERLTPQDGNATYRNYMIDAMYHLDGETLKQRAKLKRM